jgi:hypothetical protein
VGAGDLNGDGFPDIYAGGFSLFKGLVIYASEGKGRYNKVRVTLDFGIGNPESLATGDFNGDGLTDIVADKYNGIDQTSGGFVVLLQKGMVLHQAESGQTDGKPGDQKISVPGNGSADAGEVTKGQRYWFEASGLIGINVGGPNGGPATKADPDGRTISQTDGTVTAPDPADARFPCPGLATHSLVGRIGGAGGAQPSRPAKPALMQGKSGIAGEGEPSVDGAGAPGAAPDYVQLGSKGSFVAPASGRLTLLCNDLIPGDNSGAWEVRISR